MEKEYKFTASPEMEKGLFEYVSLFELTAPETVRMSSVYYDTKDGALFEKGVALRMRDENGKKVMTLKGPSDASAGFSAREEREIEVSSFEEGLSAFKESLPEGSFEPVCRVEFVRKRTALCVDGTFVEFAFDVGNFGSEDEKFCEVELELKKGDEAEFASFSEKIREKFGLKPENRSKYRRALDCARRGKNGK